MSTAIPSLFLNFCHRSIYSCIIYPSRADNENRDIMQSTGEDNSSATSATIITTSVSPTGSAPRDEEHSVSEEMILACCQEGDVMKLRLWYSLDVNVLYSAAPLIRAAAHG